MAQLRMQNAIQIELAATVTQAQHTSRKINNFDLNDYVKNTIFSLRFRPAYSHETAASALSSALKSSKPVNAENVFSFEFFIIFR